MIALIFIALTAWMYFTYFHCGLEDDDD